MSSEGDFQAIPNLDRLIHEPARLAILAVLAGCESADFQFLLDATGLNKGNLSAQAIKLHEAGYLMVEKGFNGRYPSTRYCLTPAGRDALANYSKQMRITLEKLDDAA